MTVEELEERRAVGKCVVPGIDFEREIVLLMEIASPASYIFGPDFLFLYDFVEFRKKPYLLPHP